MVVVPLYDTLGPGAVRYIINTGEPSCPLLSLVASPTSPSQPSAYADCLTLVNTLLPFSENTGGFHFWPLNWLTESPVGLYLKALSTRQGCQEGASTQAPHIGCQPSEITSA